MNDLKSGWPPHGVDLNSGWNCTPMNHGCTVCGSSTISVSFSRWVIAEITRPGLGEPVEVVLVGLVAVAMPLGDDVAVDLVRQRARLDVGALRAQAHRAAEVGLRVRFWMRAVAVLPLVDQGDHRVRRVGIELGAVGAGQAGLVARVLDRRDLHAEADAEVGDLRSRARTGRRGSCPRRRACRSRRARGSRRSAPRLATLVARQRLRSRRTRS